LKGKLNSILLIPFLIAGLAGCASPNKLAVFEEGPLHVQSAFVNSYLQDPHSWSGTVKAVSTDGHEAIAQSVNKTLEAAGYTVPDHEKALVTYYITELYAGPASGYVDKSAVGADTVFSTGLSVISSFAACAALNACGSSGFVGNSTANVLTTASNSANSGQGQQFHDSTAVSLVVHKVCSAGSCASSAAASADPDVTIEELRRVNVDQGVPRTMRLKCTFKQFGPIKSVDQC